MTWGAMAQRESLVVERAGIETPSFQKPQGSFPFCFKDLYCSSFSFAKSKVDFADPTMVISRSEDSGHSGKLLPTPSNPFVISS